MKICLLVLAVAISASVYCNPLQTGNEIPDAVVLADNEIQEANSAPYWLWGWWYPDWFLPGPEFYKPRGHKHQGHRHKVHKTTTTTTTTTTTPKPTTTTTTTPKPTTTTTTTPKPTTTTTTTPKPTTTTTPEPTTTTTTTTPKPTTTTTTTTPKPTTRAKTEPPPPPKPKAYVVVNDAVSFEDAEKHCEMTGAHLATPETPVEVQKIEGYAAHIEKDSCPTGEIWIGLRQNVESGNFTWVTRIPLGRFTYWTPEFSVEKGSCVSQSLNPGRGVEWHKQMCSRNLCYICEFIY